MWSQVASLQHRTSSLTNTEDTALGLRIYRVMDTSHCKDATASPKAPLTHQLPISPKQASPSCFLSDAFLPEVAAPATYSLTKTFLAGCILHATDAEMYVPIPNFPLNPRVKELLAT